MGNASICDNTLSNRSGNDRLKNRAAGVVPSAARQSKLCSAVHTSNLANTFWLFRAFGDMTLTFRANNREKNQIELSSWDEQTDHSQARANRRYPGHHRAV